MEILRSQKGTILPILLLVLALILGGYLYFSRLNQNLVPALPSFGSQKLTLSLESPNKNTVAADDQVLIKGETLPNTTVVIYNETDEVTLESDQNGKFQSLLTLGEGENKVTVTSFAENGDEKTLVVDIAYQPES